MRKDQQGSDPTATAVAGLAREVESLRRRIEQQAPLTGRVRDLARTVTQLAAEVAEQSRTVERIAVTSWLALPAEADPRGWLDALVDWVRRVFLRYTDAAKALPHCWLWHPDIVEELCWLHDAWSVAYCDEGATVAMAADWHDRYRPGVVRRIAAWAGNCSLENHQSRNGDAPTTPAVAPAGAVPLIAEWWTTRRHEAAPAPTADQMAAAPDPEPMWRGRR